MIHLTTRSEAETEEVGRRLAAELVPDGVLLLSGELGAGKTVLVKGIAAGLGIARDEVQSPTFTLMRSHQGSEGTLLHVDLYRLEPSDIPDLGLEEALYAPGVKVVEWAERLPFLLPGARRVTIARTGESTREISELEGDPGGEARLQVPESGL